MASSDVESLQNSLKLIVEIRSKASELFKTVLEGSGAKDDGGGGGHQNRETKYLSEVKLRLDTIDTKIKELDGQINKPQTTVSHPLGHSLYLNTDPASQSMALYQALVSGYKWWNKAHDYACGAGLALNQNSLNRSTGKVTKSRRRPGGAGGGGSSSHIAPPQALDKLIAQTSALYRDMGFRVTRPNGSKSNAIVEVTLDRLLTASLVFKGLMIEWVMVRGFDEPAVRHPREAAAAAGGAGLVDSSNNSGPDVWTESRYQVFRRITDNSNAAMLNFQHILFPDLAAKSFFTYLHSFVTLFTDKCRNCGYHLHNNLPPTWREFKSLVPYHEDCRR